jgi:HK97 family phage prohead protease
VKIEIRSDSVHLSGYVNAVERHSAVLPQRVCRAALGDFVEVIRSGTFAESLKRNPDVALRFNHERTVADSVELREDNIGLHAEATVSDAEIVRAAREHKLTGWSFGFTRPEAQWTGPDDEGIYTRSISSLDLVEVSILTKRPAYPATSVEVRDGEAQEYEYRQLEEETEVEDLTTDLEPEKEAIKSTMDVRQAELDLLNLTKWEEK